MFYLPLLLVIRQKVVQNVVLVLICEHVYRNTLFMQSHKTCTVTFFVCFSTSVTQTTCIIYQHQHHKYNGHILYTFWVRLHFHGLSAKAFLKYIYIKTCFIRKIKILIILSTFFLETFERPLLFCKAK